MTSGTGLRVLGGVIISVNFFSELENEMNFCLKQVSGKKPRPRPPAGLVLPPKEIIPEQKDPEGPSRLLVYAIFTKLSTHFSSGKDLPVFLKKTKWARATALML